MKIFITSNQQFGRFGAISEFNRDFSTIDEMNTHLINKWNSVVSDEDIVYVLGDFMWDPETAEKIIVKLKGTVFATLGTYDYSIEEISKFGNINIVKRDINYDENLKICMSYWPLKDWPFRNHGSISVIGKHGDEFKTSHGDSILNVSCDYWDYKPVDVKKILNLFNEVKLEI